MSYEILNRNNTPLS